MYQCAVCRQWVSSGMQHNCAGYAPPYGGWNGGWNWPTYQPSPLTADEIRKIVREELDRPKPKKRTASSASDE
jgi:hypothetical protein